MAMSTSAVPRTPLIPGLDRYLLDRDRGVPLGTTRPGAISSESAGAYMRKVTLEWTYIALRHELARVADFFVIGIRSGSDPVGQPDESSIMVPALARSLALYLPLDLAFSFAITPARITHAGGFEQGARLEPSVWSIPAVSSPAPAAQAVLPRVEFLESPDGSRTAFTPATELATDVDGYLQACVWRQQVLPDQVRTNPPAVGAFYWSGSQVIFHGSEPPMAGERVYLVSALRSS